MATPTKTSPPSVVIDANVVIALCAKEPDKQLNAEKKINEYASGGSHFFAPGVIVAECLYIFCKKLTDGVITAIEHGLAIQAFIAMMAMIDPPPSGDKSLIQRAEEIRKTYGCSHSADGIYLALAEELSKTGTTEVVTFDKGMKNQAAASSLIPDVVVLLTV